MTHIAPQDWRPVGVNDLEPNAWRALRQTTSVSVVAGPGAGKTEFLAQRAVYLLQTNTCPRPRRILAISFKTDAAENLAARVRQRCPPELANRFVSQTFDAFTKGLVDRFRGAIPAHWRPSHPYEVFFPSRRQVETVLDRARDAASAPEWKQEIAGLRPTDFESKNVGPYQLATGVQQPVAGAEFAVQCWLRALLNSTPSKLSFVVINRLAELLLRSNPQIACALQSTYPVVFVDEFQDTTYAQYSFLRSAFGSGRTSVTAVGDDKQRIMAWAGARVDAFGRFEQDFSAQRIPLLSNFRSSPALVAIQHVVARHLEADFVQTQARAQSQIVGDAAQVWVSATRDGEAAHLGQWLAADIASRGNEPRDYAILVRQKADMYESELSPALASVGLQIRNESRTIGRMTLQDLLVDTYCEIAIAVIQLGAARRAPQAWVTAATATEQLRGVDHEDEVASAQAVATLARFLLRLRQRMASLAPSAENAALLLAEVTSFLEIAAIKRTYLEYSTGDLLEIAVEATGLHLAACCVGATTWQETVDKFLGTSQVPLLTVHKSKGLEYDTIIFVGMDDQAWWSFSADNPEGLATFFVALSRAKQKAIFSFCEERGQRQRVAFLYQLLTEAGVGEVSLDAS
jgi:superfamily I DNA/RNA helicase